jgi:predicted ATPase/DNA-binding CsgD family transcriptional regulator
VLTSFVGRGREIAEVRRLLAGTRLLTLTGSGGCGKTRLALEVARGVASEYPHGVWFVDLAAIHDPQLVPAAVASVFGILERPERSAADALVAALRAKTILLVLDNCEQLLPGSAVLVEALLRACPDVRIVATSREPFGLTGETQWRVPPLSLPDPGRGAHDASADDGEAVQLFRERAKASSASFDITERNAAAVRQICARLDGIPLAIELAAARVRAFGVEEIAARLDDRLLAGTSPTANPRHQTLRAVTDWSYALLSEAERTMFRRLAVFAGGWTLAAAEAVCLAPDEPRADAPDLLMRLVDKSLVLADTRQSEARYRMLETVRRYAFERLRESGEERETLRRHRAWYLDLARAAEPRLIGRDQKEWLDRLEVEHDNLRAALEFCRTDEDAEPELRLAGTLYWFWFLHGHWAEGRRRLEGALARAAGGGPAPLPKVLQGAMFFAWRQGDFGRAITLGERGLAVCAEQHDDRGRARLLTWLALSQLQQGGHRTAAALAEQSLAVARELNDKWLLSLALGNLGTVARHEGDYARAARYYGECLALAREVEDNFRISYSLRNIGIVAMHQEDYDQASAAYKESLIVGRDIGDRWVAEECFVGLAGVASARGDHEQAARLLGAADALRDALGHRFSPADQADYNHRVARTRAGLGEVRFAAAVAQGRAMPLDEAIADALIPTVAQSPGKGQGTRPGGLTVRELEVAALVALGSTNREIAARLGVSPRTVDVHVEHILSKLEVRSRSQIAVWAAEHRVTTPYTGSVSSNPRGA